MIQRRRSRRCTANISPVQFGHNAPQLWDLPEEFAVRCGKRACLGALRAICGDDGFEIGTLPPFLTAIAITITIGSCCVGGSCNWLGFGIGGDLLYLGAIHHNVSVGV